MITIDVGMYNAIVIFSYSGVANHLPIVIIRSDIRIYSVIYGARSILIIIIFTWYWHEVVTSFCTVFAIVCCDIAIGNV